MKTRKLVLLVADALLLVALIFQICLNGGDKTKVFQLSDQPEEITISSAAESYTLIKENDAWFVGDKKYPANESFAVQMADALMSVKVLDKVASGNSDSTLEKYQLADDQKITVTAKKSGSVVRTLYIGKDANAGSQTYVMIDNSKDIYLSAGNLRNDFDKTVSYLRSRIVFDVEKKDINSVSITDADNNSWAITKMGNGTDVVWNSSDNSVQIDEEKALNWFNSLSAITTPNWYDDASSLGGKLVASAKIGVGFKSVSIDVYALPLDVTQENPKQKYWAKCSESPYPFEMADYTAQKFLKKLEEFVK